MRNENKKEEKSSIREQINKFKAEEKELPTEKHEALQKTER